MLAADLRKLIEGGVFEDSDTLESVETDFGRVVKKRPAVVAVPSSSMDVQKIVEYANANGISVSSRGSAHSQSGQCLNQDGILIDSSGLCQVGQIDNDSVWVDAGVLWGDLVAKLHSTGYLPPVLTNNLGVTIGGTLSMAGLGIASHQFGAQVDNVLELEVVTGDGHVVRCSSTENADLFDCSRSGLGQFSIITSARLRLRPVGSMVRTFFLLYDDMTTLMRDQEKIIREERIGHIESWCAPCVQGIRRVGDARLPFAEWFYPMQLSVEYESEAPGEEVLEGLNYYRRTHVEDNPVVAFANRLEPVFELWKQAGTWNMAHPWMEVVLPWQMTAQYIEGVLQNFPPNLLLGGHVLLWPCRGTTSTAPLFMHPGGDLVMGFGILPAVPHQFLPMTLPLLKKASDLCTQIGGKRYLSGWVEFNHDQWKAHFGPMWSKVVSWKQFYDPKGTLNPGFIQYQAD